MWILNHGLLGKRGQLVGLAWGIAIGYRCEKVTWRAWEIFLQVGRSLDINQSQYVCNVFKIGSQFIEVKESLGGPQYWKLLDNGISKKSESIMSRIFCLETRFCWALHSPSMNPGTCAGGGGIRLLTQASWAQLCCCLSNYLPVCMYSAELSPFELFTCNHRNIELLGLEGTSWDHLVHPHLLKQSQLQ